MAVADSNAQSQSQYKSTTSSLLSRVYLTIHSINLTILNTLASLLDAIIPPSRRDTLKAQFTSLSQSRPLFASFLLSQVLFSGVPLFLFALQAVSIFVFSFTTALVVASLCALTFTTVCVGLALVVLVPVLLVTTALAVGVWGWAWVGWYVLKCTGLVDADGLGKGKVEGEAKGVNADADGVEKKEDGY